MKPQRLVWHYTLSVGFLLCFHERSKPSSVSQCFSFELHIGSFSVKKEEEEKKKEKKKEKEKGGKKGWGVGWGGGVKLSKYMRDLGQTRTKSTAMTRVNNGHMQP